MQDKYTATWVSYTSIKDFIDCPQAYFYKHVYRDPISGNKIKLVNPPLSLGKAVHEVLEGLSKLPLDRRFAYSPVDRFYEVWKKVSGQQGGFTDSKEEDEYRKKGQRMISQIVKNPGPLSRLAVKIKQDLPYFWLSEEDNIILCGKIDWLEYLEDDSVGIIDFKTGREEKNDSLQLPIYLLLTSNCQSHKITRVSYWYLATDPKPKEQKLPDVGLAREKVMKIAKEIKLARSLGRFRCHHGSCRHCREMERIIAGEATLVGQDEYGASEYMLSPKLNHKESSEIL